MQESTKEAGTGMEAAKLGELMRQGWELVGWKPRFEPDIESLLAVGARITLNQEKNFFEISGLPGNSEMTFRKFYPEGNVSAFDLTAGSKKEYVFSTNRKLDHLEVGVSTDGASEISCWTVEDGKSGLYVSTEIVIGPNGGVKGFKSIDRYHTD